MKRFTISLLIVLMLLLAPSAAFADRDVIRYESELNYPPFQYMQNGYLTGFDVDLTNLIFEKQDYLVHYGTGPWKEVHEKLIRGTIDTTGLMAVTGEAFGHSDYYSGMVGDRLLWGFGLSLALLIVGICAVKAYIAHLRRAIHREQRFFEDVVEHTGVFVWAVDRTGVTVRFNRTAEQLTGWKARELLGTPLDGLAGGESMERLRLMLSGFLRGEAAANVEMQLPGGCGNGRYLQFRTSYIPPTGKKQDGLYVLIGLDIHERRENEIKLQNSYEQLEATFEELSAAEEELQQQLRRLSVSEQRFRLASDGSGAYLWELDWKNGVYKLSERWYEVMGYSAEEINAMTDGVLDLIHPEDRERADRARNDHLLGKTPVYETEYRMRSKDGAYIWYEVRGKAVSDPEEQVMLFLGSLIDISNRKQVERKLHNSYQELEATYEQLTAAQRELVGQYDLLVENQQKMHHLAYYDSLSGLPNRLNLLEAMETYFRQPGGSAALLFVDADNFKYINDTLGHKFGDELIRQASARLQRVTGEDVLLSRFGGDEFILFYRNVFRREQVQELAERILRKFREPFRIGESDLHISVSIGISFYPEDGTTTEEILKNADVANYRAKESGKAKAVVYDKSMHTSFNERVTIEKHLRGAVENNELSLYYQPQVDIRTGRISGFEALVRWNNPVLGSVSPLSFIKIAEDSRLIVPIGEWVLRQACRFMRSMHDKGLGPYRISVNLSVIQLLQEDFVPLVMDTLEESGLEPAHLELEITESIFMESFGSIISKLEYFRSCGIYVALDDFGTGYSSLSYLQQLPITTLKMDKTFIDSLSDNTQSQDLIRTIVELGHNRELEVVAEGVENTEQLNYLRSSNCDKIQGYLTGRPLPERETEALMREQKTFFV